MKSKKENVTENTFMNANYSQPIESKAMNFFLINKNSISKVYTALRKILSHLLIFVGVYLTYASSLIIFHIFLTSTQISNPLFVFFVFIFGLILTISGVGQFSLKTVRIVYASIPFMSFFLATVFAFAPESWQGKLFGEISLIFYPLILFIFYCLKENKEKAII